MTAHQMQPEDVHYIAVEGGGAGGLLTHVGVLEALENLIVVRTNQYKPGGILAWSGSSSGSIVSTLAACGYTSWEIAVLASQEAFDMVFRLEQIQQGEFAAIEGKCKKGGIQIGTVIDPTMAAVVANSIKTVDPVGGIADILHMLRVVLTLYVENTAAVYDYFRSEQLNRLDVIVNDAKKKGIERFEQLANEVYQEYKQRMKRWSSPPSNIFTLLEMEFPHLVSKLIRHIGAHSAGKERGYSLFQVLKLDFGLTSGCIWRDYIDHLIAFARFRVQFCQVLPSLALPPIEDMRAVNELGDLFHGVIYHAIEADYGDIDNTPLDFHEEYDKLRHCTFRQHANEFFDWLNQKVVPPLIISGANVVTQESHLFSSLATPDFHVADAVRIATGLPPIFKPVFVEAADIPSSWPVKKDRFGTAHYLEGLWIDGGLYYNAPFEVFKAASAAFIGEQNTMGLGSGIEERARMDNLTQFAQSFINLGYEANISTTRINLKQYLNINKFDIGAAKPKVMPKALEYYRLDAYLRTFQFFGLDPGL